MLGHIDLLNRPIIEINTIREPIVERPNQIVFKVNYFKKYQEYLMPLDFTF